MQKPIIAVSVTAPMQNPKHHSELPAPWRWKGVHSSPSSAGRTLGTVTQHPPHPCPGLHDPRAQGCQQRQPIPPVSHLTELAGEG